MRSLASVAVPSAAFLVLAAFLALALAWISADPAEAARRRKSDPAMSRRDTPAATAPAGRRVPHATKTPALPPPKPPLPGPLSFPDSQIEPIQWGDIDGWEADDHRAAFEAFRVSCRPVARVRNPAGESRDMYPALHEVCRHAIAAGRLDAAAAKKFFEQKFRPARIARLGEGAGFLTGYYEPIVEGSRFPTGVFKVPIYRRPADLLPASGKPVKSGAFPNTGKSLRRTADGTLVPYYDRGEILDGALDGRRLEICWIRDHTEALFIQIQGSARVRLEDGTMLRINYDGHNGYPYVPVGRVLIERKLIPREEMSMQRIREWMGDNPQAAEEVRRQNRSFVFFRITGLSGDKEAVGAQGVELTPGRSIAVDRVLHVYGTPFFIDAGMPLEEKNAPPFRRLMIAQDTGSAIVGPARADIYWGAGDVAGRIAGRLRHPGRFAILIPRALDPVAAGALMPLPPVKPPPKAEPPARSRIKSKAKRSGRRR
ncbi:MltA domain-containing protein [Xanthobacteraceae bacterium Astr-EGSB]|uniref:murein transglycosylase A n=1 Tax=Astrobacterium formosum TaxID=3069710 RepID=UPI0027B83EB4|nr:MltA domain-containing protein [Xanthobacteraceae bacterium Astr-EGSB]